MWFRKRDRIADLEARNSHLLRELEKARGAVVPSAGGTESLLVARLRTDLRRALSDLRETERQFGRARQEIAARSRRQVAYSNRAVANMRRLRRAVRACARYRAELSGQPSGKATGS